MLLHLGQVDGDQGHEFDLGVAAGNAEGGAGTCLTVLKFCSVFIGHFVFTGGECVEDGWFLY